MPRQPFPGGLLPPLQQDIQADLSSVTAQVGSFLEFKLPPGVARNLIAAQRDLKQAQSSVAAAVAVAEIEAGN